MSGGGNGSVDAEQGTPPVPPDTLALLAAVLSNAPFGFALVDTDLRYIHINEPLAALNGLSSEAHRGLRPADISPVLDAMVSPILRSVLETGESVVGQEFSAAPPATPTGPSGCSTPIP